MKFVIVLLLLLALTISTEARGKRVYKDLRRVYLSRAIEHKRLAGVFLTKSRRFSVIARNYHAQARSFKTHGTTNRLRARAYGAAAKRHSRLASGYRTKYLYASNKSAHHLRRNRHFTSVAIKYESLARQARSRARHHYVRYLYYIKLYNSSKRSYQREVSLKNSALRSEANHKRLQKLYSLRARTAQRSYNQYSLRAKQTQTKIRREYRLYKRYTRLHKRAVYLHNARTYKLVMKKHLKRATNALGISRQAHSNYKKWIRIEETERTRASNDQDRIALLNRRINELRNSTDSDDVDNVRKLGELLSERETDQRRHLSNATYARNKAAKHRSLEISEYRLYQREKHLASVAKTQYKRWRSLYKSTFRRVTTSKVVTVVRRN